MNLNELIKLLLMQNSLNCENSNMIYVAICQGCNEEYIREVDSAMKEKIIIYRQHIPEPQYQQLAVEEHLRNCGGGKFYMFLFFKVLQES